MSKDLFRSILAALGSLVAVFFGVSEQVIEAVIDNLITIFAAVVAVVGIVQSYLNPADDDEPRVNASN